MHIKRSVIVALAVLGLSAGLGAPVASANGGADDASEVAGKKDKEKVVFDHVMVDPLRPGEIVPCVRVMKKYFKKSQNHPELVLMIRVTYFSNGNSVQKLVSVPLSAMQLTEHHEQPEDPKWLLLDTLIDISDQPIDAGSETSGDAELIEG